MKTTWKIEGLRDLERALADLPRATSKNVARRTLKEAGEPLARSARAIVHVDRGDLKESIDVSERTAPKENKQSEMEVYVGPGRHPQAIQEEFGNVHQAAHPFLRPAWDQGKMAALDIIVTLLGIEIDKATARHARKAARLAAKGR